MLTCWVVGGVGTAGLDVESSAPLTVSVPDKATLPVPWFLVLSKEGPLGPVGGSFGKSAR